MESFRRYRPLLTSHDLWDSLRNGFSHSFVPKKTLSLSSKKETAHLVETNETQINLRCEYFYLDFKNACQEVIDMGNFPCAKMSRPLLSVPSQPTTLSDNHE